MILPPRKLQGVQPLSTAGEEAHAPQARLICRHIGYFFILQFPQNPRNSLNIATGPTEGSNGSGKEAMLCPDNPENHVQPCLAGPDHE